MEPVVLMFKGVTVERAAIAGKLTAPMEKVTVSPGT